MKYTYALIIALIASNSAFSANILRLNAYKSPIPINWKNPKKLSRITAINTLIAGKQEFGHTLGHVSISVMCEKQGIEFHTGMERTDLTESKDLVFNKGSGLGTLVHNFKGNIENDEKVTSSVNYSVDKKNGRDLNFIEFLISDKACLRAYEYYKAFKESKTWLNYGMTNDPRSCEGAGCTAYGKSYLEIVGFNDESILKPWRGQVELPRNIIGPHSTKLYKQDHSEGADLIDTGVKVNIIKLVNPLGKRVRWHHERDREKAVSIMYYSPDYMHKWVKQEFRKDNYTKRYFKKGSRSKVITIDITNIETPTEPFFKRNCDEVRTVDIEKFTKD